MFPFNTSIRNNAMAFIIVSYSRLSASRSSSKIAQLLTHFRLLQEQFRRSAMTRSSEEA
jgi:hypothetical protein